MLIIGKKEENGKKKMAEQLLYTHTAPQRSLEERHKS